MKLRYRTLSAVMAAIISLSAVTPVVSADWEETSSGISYINEETGKKVTGWQTIDGAKYYFTKKGIAVTGWKTIGESKYYFLKSKKGKMATGWVKIGGDKYYFGKDGKMRTGLRKIGGSVYYFYAEGKMCVSKTVKINGKKYTFGSDGKQVTGSDSTKLYEPFNNLKWGMSEKQILKKLDPDSYYTADKYLYVKKSESGTDMDYYIITDKGLQAYGVIKEKNSKNIKLLKACFTDAGWTEELSTEKDGNTGYMFAKDGKYGMVMYNETQVMTMILSDDINAAIAKGDIDPINSLS
ncbi:MAG: N-acetylmuramoyl-L-alanine amidase family protein [Huintestinicola sp.]